MMAWEHSLLGDLDPAQLHAAAAGDRRPADGYRELLGELGRAPQRVGEARLRGAHPWLDLVRLPGSGLAVTTGELNVLPDYLGRPEAIEAAPLRFIGPLIQSVRSWSIAELGRPWDIFDSFPDHVEQDGRLVSLPEWHRGGLRDLCFELFGQRATRAVRVVMSSAFRQLGQPIADGR